MRLTSRAMEWLNHNRHRAYPMQREPWRRVASPESGLDCVVLDATAFNSDARGDEEMFVESIDVGSDSTVVSMRYGSVTFELPPLVGGDESGEGSFVCVRGVVSGQGTRGVSVSVSLSSHRYIYNIAGPGRRELGCPLLRSRVVSLSDGMGVDSVVVNGSSGVSGHDLGGDDHRAVRDVSGDVVLEDGYRTSPIVFRDKVLFRVGNRYGLDPCLYDFGESAHTDCRKPLLFFCGQNAVNNGNVVIRGGSGVSVLQGREYLVDDRRSKCNGRRIPCVEIVAGQELLDMYKPSDGNAANMI